MPTVMEDCVGAIQHRFSPYSFNGGTLLAFAGSDFALLAADSRLSEGFGIHNRNAARLHKLSESCVLACCGFQGDCLSLLRILEARVKMYKQTHQRPMTCPAIASLLSQLLYSHRFFPYYCYCLIAGLDSQGQGAVFSFDPVGSYERVPFSSLGSASAQLQPLLDSQLSSGVQLSASQAEQLARDVFVSAAERDVYTGDSVQVCLVSSAEVHRDSHSLRKD